MSKKRPSHCRDTNDESEWCPNMPQETSQAFLEELVCDSTLVKKPSNGLCSQHELDSCDTDSHDESSEMPGASLTTAATADTGDTCFCSRASLYVGDCAEDGSVSSIGESESSTSELELVDDIKSEKPEFCSYQTLRVTYLLVTLVVMLADGLQGTHLYVLYESYGFSVASLYCLGFGTGGFLSFLTGPLVDHMGRKKAALLYCGLEIFINLLEQYPFFYGLVASRMIGGFTTNLLSTVFETWLDTEYRNRGLAKEKYETILRESVIVSNLAAIFSGYLAHVLAEWYGPVGPFQGAVSCTAIALVVIAFVWSENYGSSDFLVSHDDSDYEDDEPTKRRGSISRQVRLGGLRVAAFWSNLVQFLREAVAAFWNDSHMMRVGVAQGLSAGSLQIFVFLWAPMLRDFALSCPRDRYGLDMEGLPAFGLIFGAYMSSGVLGGFVSPPLRRWVESVVTPIEGDLKTIEVEGEGIVPVRPMAVEVLVSICYLLSAALLFVPYMLADGSTSSFSIALAAFLMYEMMIGIFLPFEGVMRSLYFPSSARASIMALPRLIVNVAVAMGVVSTNYISFKTAFGVVGSLMVIAAVLQLSLVSQREWSSLFSRANNLNEKCVRKPMRRLSSSIRDAVASSSPSLRRISSFSSTSSEGDADLVALKSKLE